MVNDFQQGLNDNISNNDMEREQNTLQQQQLQSEIMKLETNPSQNQVELAAKKQQLKNLETKQKELDKSLPLTTQITNLQITKGNKQFNICQNILAYQQDNNLTDEELAEKINLSIPEMEEILFCQIDKFTLDRLMTYANSLFTPAQVKITIAQPELRKRT
ncbi:7369_t:CDS:2, partial [Entrophospora sp. SA101]